MWILSQFPGGSVCGSFLNSHAQFAPASRVTWHFAVVQLALKRGICLEACSVEPGWFLAVSFPRAQERICPSKGMTPQSNAASLKKLSQRYLHSLGFPYHRCDNLFSVQTLSGKLPVSFSFQVFVSFSHSACQFFFSSVCVIFTFQCTLPLTILGMRLFHKFFARVEFLAASDSAA